MNLEYLVGITVGGRFQTTRLLKQSRAGACFLGTDLDRREKVVIKALALRELTPGTQMRLEHEAALRRRVASPWLAPVIEALREGELFFSISRYIPGTTLAERLREGALALPDALTLAQCLFSALRDLHAHRLLHRDVKPSHLLIGESPVIVTATLTDFGAPGGLCADALLRDQGREAAWYLSPEHAGTIDRDVAETSDLYSAGVVLFHCLAGRPPFAGDCVSTVLFEHLTARVPELRSLGLEIPRALEEIVQRLLRKDPRDRYQTAEAVLGDLLSLTQALERGELDPDLAIGARDRRVTLTEPAFVARNRELAVLDEHLLRAKRGHAGLVLVEGRSGNGKTRLLVELAQRASREGLWVLRGQATTEVGQRPFRVLEGVVDRFLSAARSDRALADSVRGKLGPQCEVICSALPQLREVFPVRDSENPAPEALGEARALRALGEFLDALAEPHRPVLLILDDCQWADELTCKLLGRWQQSDEARGEGRHVMVVAAYRSEEAAPDHLLRSVVPAAHLELGPLEPAQVRRLAESMAGPLPQEAADVVIRLAEGSPFMASAVLRGLVESGALLAGTDGWRIEPLALTNLQSSNQAASFLTRRIELLPQLTVELLSVGAVLGKEFDLNMAARLSAQSPAAAIDALDEARQRQLVWVRPDGGQCVFVHDKIRAALLERQPLGRRRELHYAAARHLQQTAPERASELAYHFDAAGETREALRYALEAAEKARAQHSLEVAEQQYRIAQRGAADAELATRFRIAEGLGDVLMLRGRYDAAAPLLEQAARLAEGRLPHAEIHEKLGELAFKRGDKESATREFENTLRRLGCFVPRSLPVFLALLVWEAFVQVLHSLFPALLVHRCKRPPSNEVRLQLRLYSRLTHGYWFTRGKAPTLWAHLRGMNLGEWYPPTLELANAYSEHAPVISLIPLFRRARAYAERSLKIRQDFGDLWGQGQSLTFYGCVLYYSSRFHECIEKSREAIRLLERMGDYWLVHIARYQIAASLYRLGELQAAVEECRINHKSGLELRDEQASGIILDVWTRATAGVIPEGLLEVELQRDRQDAQGAAQVLLAEGVRRLGADDLSGAVDVLQQAITTARAAGIQNAYTLPALAWLATALRLRAERTDPYRPALRRALLRDAERAARRAVRAARICANDLPHALREVALLQAMSGRYAKARRLLRKSLATAARQQAQSEYAQTLEAFGRIGRQRGWPGAAEQLAQAELLLQELRPAREESRPNGAERDLPATLSLADRFDTVLDAGRKIASALTKDAIYEEAQAAALRLLRGERCRMIELDAQDNETWRPLDQSGHDNVDRRMVARAVRTGRAVAFAEEVAESNSDQAGASESSAICVPIHVRGRTAACLYMTHHQVRGLFGADEERLADFIAAIAGAALENAEGFHQLQTLNETLEQRVAERTAAAEFRARELARSNEELERVAQELRRTEEQLRVAIDAAQSASHAKTRFLTTMSHEIRTPMNGILGMTELALQTPLSQQQRNYLGVIKQSGASLLALLNDVLDLSKIEAGRMELEDIPFDVREVVGASVRLLAVTAAQKGVELVCRIDSELPAELVGDPTRLRQVIVNLVGNAIKFTSEGYVFVNVFVEHADGEMLHVTVQDTGVGIPTDKIDAIFESFQQADTSTTRRYGGTGLGLSISSQLAGLMGGRIWAESELGRGSTFHFVIPLRTTAPVHDSASQTQRRGAQSNSTPLRGLQVLWFSDHALSRRVYGELLENCGAVVISPATREDAIAALGTRTDVAAYDAIVADVAGANSEGWRLIETIGADARTCSIPIVALAAAGKPCPTNHSNAGTPIHILTKPPLAAEVADAVLAAAGRAASPGNDHDENLLGERLDSLHLLLAEDGLVNQEVALGLLEIAGHTVEVANNGREAVEKFQRGSFDAVLMDLEMPELDGLEATRCIREYESITGDRTPIIAMTAHAISSFRERCLESGMDGYVTKPIELRELLRVLKSVTGNRPAGAVKD